MIHFMLSLFYSNSQSCLISKVLIGWDESSLPSAAKPQTVKAKLLLKRDTECRENL
jgi:hypothetical protein